MLKRNLFIIAIIFAATVFSVNAFGQGKTSKATSRTVNPRTAVVNKVPKSQVFLGGGNDSWNTRQKLKPKTKAKTAVNRSRTTNSNQRRTKPVRNLEAGSGGLDTTNESPTFGDTMLRKNNPTRTQTNILPYMEQQNVTKSRIKYANQEVSYRRKAGKRVRKN